jgi:hypothetical protein
MRHRVTTIESRASDLANFLSQRLYEDGPLTPGGPLLAGAHELVAEYRRVCDLVVHGSPTDRELRRARAFEKACKLLATHWDWHPEYHKQWRLAE